MTVPQYIDQSPRCLPAGHLAEISMVSPEFREGSKSTWETTSPLTVARAERPRVYGGDRPASLGRKPRCPRAPEGRRRGCRASADPSHRTRGIPRGHRAAPQGSVGVGVRPAAAGGCGFPSLQGPCRRGSDPSSGIRALPDRRRVEARFAVRVLTPPPYLGWTASLATAGWCLTRLAEAENEKESRSD